MTSPRTKRCKHCGMEPESRQLSAARTFEEALENRIEAEQGRQQQFFGLAERLRNEPDAEQATHLGG